MKYSFLLLFISICLNAFSQCSINSILPFKMGMSKIEILETVSGSVSPKFKEIIDLDVTSYSKSSNRGRKVKFSYLKDSVLQNHFMYDVYYNQCLKSKDARVNLSLVNDKLYKVSLIFNCDNFAEMKALYNELTKMKVYGYNYSSVFSIVNNLEETVGEGILYAPTEYYDITQVKMNELRIEYKIEFEREYDKITKKSYETNVVSEYNVIINVINLNSTPLTKQGY